MFIKPLLDVDTKMGRLVFDPVSLIENMLLTIFQLDNMCQKSFIGVTETPGLELIHLCSIWLFTWI